MALLLPALALLLLLAPEPALPLNPSVISSPYEARDVLAFTRSRFRLCSAGSVYMPPLDPPPPPPSPLSSASRPPPPAGSER